MLHKKINNAKLKNQTLRNTNRIDGEKVKIIKLVSQKIAEHAGNAYKSDSDVTDSDEDTDDCTNILNAIELSDTLRIGLFLW